MRARIACAQRSGSAACSNILHGVQRQISGLCRFNAFRLREALIKHRAIFSNHRTQCRQWRTVAAAGDRLKRLRHFNRRQVHGTEQHRRHRIQLIFRHAQFGPGIYHAGQPQRHAEIYRWYVHGVGQRIHQHHFTAKAAIVVLRFPDLAVRLLQRDWLIGNPAVEAIAVWLAERGQVSGRFRQRADGTTRLQRTVITGKLRVRSAHHGTHFAGETIHHHHRGFQILQSTLFFQRWNALFHRLLGGILGDGIKRGEDFHAGEVFDLIAHFRLQLVTHHLHKRRLWRDHAAFRLHAERTGAEHVIQLLIDHLLLLQQTQHEIAAFQRQLRITPRIVERCAFHHAHQQRLLIETQLIHRTTKVVEAGQRKAADLIVARLTEIDLVQVKLKDAIFAVARIHDHRHIGFSRFTPQRTLAGQEQVFRQLLR